jgi:DNA-binding Lrp family transcriptional regulator
MLKKTKDIEKEDIIVQNVIKKIKKGYFACLDFFSKHNKINQEFQLKLFKLTTEITDIIFNDVHSITIEIIAEKIDSIKIDFILIKTNTVFLEYPLIFIKYMKWEENNPNFPLNRPDLKELTNFMTTHSAFNELDQFFDSINEIVQRIKFKLRKTELLVIQKCIDLSFLNTKSDGTIRIRPPNQEDLLSMLKINHNSKKNTLVSSLNLIKQHKICEVNRLIFNPFRLGYQVVKSSQHFLEDYPELSRFVVWKFQIKKTDYSILWIPYNKWINIRQLEEIQFFTELYWNINLNQYNENLEWEKFSIPLYFSRENPIETTNYLHWKYEDYQKTEMDNIDWSIIKELMIDYILEENKIINLKEKLNLTTKDVNYRLKKLVSMEIYKIVPKINHLGINKIVFLQFKISDDRLKRNFIHILMKLPITLILLNDEYSIGICYLIIPSELYGKLIKFIRYFNKINKPDYIDISDI